MASQVRGRKKDLDGGWGWCVLCASYANLLLCSGLSYAAGMFQVVFLQEFNGSVALTSWVTSLFSSFMQLGGPLSSALANTANCRTAVMVGGACLAVGLSLSALVDSLGLLFICFGIVAGVGLGLTFTSSIVVINYYFHERRTMVTGIALSSGGLGIMLAPQASTFLFQNFSWREALSLMSVAAAQVCVFGALMFPMHEENGSNSGQKCLSWLRQKLSRLWRGNKSHIETEKGYNTDLAEKLVEGKEEEIGERNKTDDRHKNVSIGHGHAYENGNNKKCVTETIRQNEHLGTEQTESLLPVNKGSVKNLAVPNGVSADGAELYTTVNENGRSSNGQEALVHCAKSDLELPPITEGLSDSDRHVKASAGAHIRPYLQQKPVDINNSTSSLREDRGGCKAHQQHHRYMLKLDTPKCVEQNGRQKGGNCNHLSTSYPKSVSHYDLSEHANRGQEFYGLRETFSSDRHLPSQQGNLPSPRKAAPHLDSSSEMKLGGHQARPHANHTSRGSANGLTTSRPSSRATEEGTPSVGRSSQHLHVTVVPHNQSLLSLVASTKHLDLVLHHDGNDSRSPHTETVLSPGHPLHTHLHGNGSSKPGLSLSRVSLQSTVSFRHRAHSSLVHPSSRPESPAIDQNPNLAESVASQILIAENTTNSQPLYRNTAFLLLCVQLFIANCACGVFNIHLPSFAMSKGLTDQQMTNVLSLNGLALLFGRMLVGALASATGLELLIYWALHVIGGLFILVLPPFATSYPVFCALIVGVGTFFGSVYSVLTSLTIKYVGLCGLATAFGVEMICAGLGYLLAPPVAGLLVDITGSYDYDMYCGGALLILSALVLMLLPVIKPEVTREDLRKSFGEGHGLGLDVQLEDCTDCIRDDCCVSDGEEDMGEDEHSLVDKGDGDNGFTDVHLKKTFSEKESKREGVENV